MSMLLIHERMSLLYLMPWWQGLSWQSEKDYWTFEWWHFPAAVIFMAWKTFTGIHVWRLWLFVQSIWDFRSKRILLLYLVQCWDEVYTIGTIVSGCFGCKETVLPAQTTQTFCTRRWQKEKQGSTLWKCNPCPVIKHPDHTCLPTIPSYSAWDN